MASVLKTPDDETFSARIEDLVARLSDTPAAPAAKAIHQVCTTMDLLLSGQTLEDILPDNSLTNLHEFIVQSDRSQFIRNLGHSKPNLRILEIGTGKGSLKSDIIKNLTCDNGQILCSMYTYTSPGYISGKDQEQLFPKMEYRTLDINQDPFEQGFEDREYDLILAVNALHTTKNLQESLTNVKKLLCPDGRMLLQELCPSSKWVNYVFGILPAWWLGTIDGRTEEPYIGAERWKSELAAAGFGGIEGTVLDAEESHQLTVTMVARHGSFTKTTTKPVTVLCEEYGAFAEQVLSQLEKEGFQVTTCKLDDVPPAGQDVISLLDIKNSLFENIDETRFQSFKNFVHRVEGGRILWVTHLTAIGCRDPRFAQVIGLARVIRSEMLADFATCEVDHFDNSKSVDNIIRVLSKFQARQNEDTLNPDFEWAIWNGQVQIGRFHSFALPDELLVSEPNEKAILDVRTPGRINSLHWVRQPREDLEADEVEVQVHSAGLNFRVS